jgi:hypothetical protein
MDVASAQTPGHALVRNRLGQRFLGSLHDHLHFPQVIFDRLEGNVVVNV